MSRQGLGQADNRLIRWRPFNDLNSRVKADLRGRLARLTADVNRVFGRIFLLSFQPLGDRFPDRFWPLESEVLEMFVSLFLLAKWLQRLPGQLCSSRGPLVQTSLISHFWHLCVIQTWTNMISSFCSSILARSPLNVYFCFRFLSKNLAAGSYVVNFAQK